MLRKKIMVFLMPFLLIEYCCCPDDMRIEPNELDEIQNERTVEQFLNSTSTTAQEFNDSVLEIPLEAVNNATESKQHIEENKILEDMPVLTSAIPKLTNLTTMQATTTPSTGTTVTMNITTTAGSIDAEETTLDTINAVEPSTKLSAPMAANVKKDGNRSRVLTELPSDCSQRERLKKQPQVKDNSSWRKCCPHGESLNINQSDQLCVPTDKDDYEAEIIQVELYDNCIEDLETQPKLPVEIGNLCNKSFLYNSIEDRFVVLQDGSLLVMDKNVNESYAIEQKYCLDYDYDNNNSESTVHAIICITSVEEHLGRSQVVIVAIFMLISIPFLLLLSYLHVRIKLLRTIHGLSLACMSLCLAMGYSLYALAYIFDFTSSKIAGYTTQFFIIAYFMWFLCICFNSSLNIWYKFPNQKGLTKTTLIVNFVIYAVISIGVSTTLVYLSIQKGLSGMPSYFVQGYTESIRESQRYFIPPISTILILSFLLIVTSFFGFQRIKKMGAIIAKRQMKIYATLTVHMDMHIYSEIKKDAKCITLLWLVMAITWILEVVTFYSPGPQNYLMFMEIMNGLQGIFVLLIFFVVRNRRAMILHWWYDRGTHNLEAVEMRTINSNRYGIDDIEIDTKEQQAF